MNVVFYQLIAMNRLGIENDVLMFKPEVQKPKLF